MSTTIESLELEVLSNFKGSESGLDKLTASLKKLEKATSQLSNINDELSKSYSNLRTKLKSAAAGIKSTVSKIESAIKKTNEYIENVNLFTVSLGKYADEAKGYAESVGELMGIDPGEWMRSQGVFMTLATGFGVAGDRAYTMSQQLTQLGYDLSSFFNIEVGDAMEKLQSGISGELEPLRRLGYDLSQAKLEATALALGIDKSVSSMTQAEKAQLRYYAIMTQVTTAQGDMSRTLEAPANQLRILKAQVTQMVRAIGSIFIPAMNALLPYIIAVTKVIRILANTIASLFGFTMPEVDYSGIDTVTGGAEDASNALDDAADSAKKLKSYMLGFDELNVINPDEGQGSALDDALGQFDFDLPTYDFIGGATESRVAKIVEEMKEWLGITDDINSWSELMDTRFGTILKSALAIGAAIALWKVTDTFMSAIATLKALLANPFYSILVGLTLTIIGFSGAFDAMGDTIKSGLDGFNFAGIVGNSLLGAGGAALLGSSLATWIETAFTGSAVDLAFTQAGINLGVGTVGAAGAALAAGIAGIVLGIPAYFVGIYDACKEGIDWLSGLLIPAGATAAGAGIGVIIGAIGGPIGAGVGALIGLAVGALTDLVILAVQHWDKISQFFVNMWAGICEFFAPVGEWFDTYVIQPVVGFFSGATKRIGQFFEGCWLIIRAVWLIVSTWFNENVIQPTVAFFKGLWEDVSEFFSKLWEDICEIFTPVFKWFDETVIQPVKDAFEKACEKIGEFFSTLWLGVRQGVASAMNGVIGAVEGAINWVVDGINNLIKGFNKVVQWAADILGEDWGGVTLIGTVKFSRVEIPQYADGAFDVPAGQLFIAREAGAEMVGSIGSRTAVANNDQIVSGIAHGVAEANGEQNSLLREQNDLLRALLEKESGVYLDGRSLTNSVEKYQRERGRVIMAGGVV